MKIVATKIDPHAAQVDLAYPDEKPARLKLEVPFGQVHLSPGGNSIVKGQVVYNLAELKPAYSVKGRTVRIRQEWRVLLPIEGRNRWELALGTAEPFGLELKAGASQSEVDLSGVPLTDLDLETGAGEMHVVFNDPNPARLVDGEIQAGAGKLVLEGLLNANIESLKLQAGAGQLKALFTGGPLTASGKVKIEGGVGESILVIDPAAPVRVRASTGLGSTEVAEGLLRRDNGYETESYAGATARLDIQVSTGVGAIKVQLM